jgi:hypothetical protein
MAWEVDRQGDRRTPPSSETPPRDLPKDVLAKIEELEDMLGEVEQEELAPPPLLPAGAPDHAPLRRAPTVPALPPRKPRMPRKRRRKKSRSLPAIAVVLVLGLGLLVSLVVAPLQGGSRVRVDGDSSEWSSVRSYEALASLDVPAHADITRFSFLVEGLRLSLLVTVRGTALEGSLGDPPLGDSVTVLIDSDANPASGYSAGGIGADVAVTAAGRGSQVHSASLLRFSGTDTEDFGGFTGVGPAAAAASGGNVELQASVSGLEISPRSAFLPVTTGHDRATDTLGYPVSGSRPTVIVSQEPPPGSTHQRTSDALLTMLMLSSTAPLTVDSIRLQVPGKLAKIGGTAGEAPVAGGIADVKGVRVDAAASIEVRGDLTTLSPADIAGARVESVSAQGADALVAVAGTSEDAFKYVANAPGAIAIDGAFGEWPSLDPSPAGEPTTGGYANVDLLGTKAASAAGDLLLRVRVAGTLFGGQPVPIPRTAVGPGALRDGDRDTVPDAEDRHPDDFDNDQTPDSQESAGGCPDVDSDNQGDAPCGPDLWLETTIPADFPPPYANRVVRQYAGEVEGPPAGGEDRVFALVDSDNRADTGYAFTPVGADALVTLAGRQGRLATTSVESFAGSNPGEWKWKPTSSPAKPRAAHDSAGLEASVNSTALALGAQFRVLFRTTDWDNATGDQKDSGMLALDLRGPAPWVILPQSRPLSSTSGEETDLPVGRKLEAVNAERARALAPADPRLRPPAESDAPPGALPLASGFASNVRANSVTAAMQNESAIATGTDGTIYIVYTDEVSGMQNISFVKSTDGGATWTAPVLVSEPIGGLCPTETRNDYRPRLAVYGTGASAVINVAWVEEDRTVVPWDHDICAARSTNGGASFTQYTSLSGTASDEPWVDIAVDSTGQYVHVVFERAGTLRNKRSTDGGASFAGSVQIFNSIYSDSRPLVASYGATATSHVHVVFRLDYSAAAQWDLAYFNSSNGGGTWESNARALAFSSTRDEFAVAGGLVADGSDRPQFTYMDAAIGASGGDIYYQRSNNNGQTFLSSVGVESVIADLSLTPAVAADADGNPYVVYSSNPLGNYDVWFTRSSNGGSSFLAPYTKLNVDSSGLSQGQPSISFYQPNASARRPDVSWWDARGGIGDIWTTTNLQYLRTVSLTGLDSTHTVSASYHTFAISKLDTGLITGWSAWIDAGGGLTFSDCDVETNSRCTTDARSWGTVTWSAPPQPHTINYVPEGGAAVPAALVAAFAAVFAFRGSGRRRQAPLR